MTTTTQQEFSQHFASQRIKSLQLRSGGLSERRTKLRSIEKWLLVHRDLIHQAEYQDLAKPAGEVDITEIYPLLSEARHAISNLKKWTAPRSVSSSLTFMGTSAHIQYEPKGASLIISPWNYPMLLALGPLISAVAAGCTVTLKPSEFTPNTNRVIGQMLNALFDQEEIHMIEGEVEVASELLKQPFDHVFFTGSPAVGKIVMKEAANHLSSVTLELGGKSPAIIDDSANVRDIAQKIAWGKWTNAGQTCIAPDYVFVHKSKKDAFLKVLKENAEKMYSDKANYASIINKRHFDRVKHYLDDALEKGAQVEFGGEHLIDECVFNPTIVTSVKDNMAVLQEEIFGPILPILTFENLEEVISYINDKPKPLALYIYSQNRKNRNRILQQTSSGGVVINDNVLQFGHPNLPMGGVNNSGIGKAHGHEGFLAFSHPKSVLKQRSGLTMLKTIYPPYTSIKKRLIALMLKYF